MKALFGLAVSVLLGVTNAQPPACFGWPGIDLLTPEQVAGFMRFFENELTQAQRRDLFKLETPPNVRVSADITGTGVQCLAGYSDSVKDVFTLQDPIVRAPASPLTRDNDVSTFLCYIHAFVYIDLYDLPDVVSFVLEVFTNLGVPFVPLNQDIVACRDNNPSDLAARAACYTPIAAANQFCPAVMAAIWTMESLDFMENDGWNAYGVRKTLTEDCTANCRNYYDYTEWQRRYDAGELYPVGGPSDPRSDPDNLWVRLLEDDGLGYFTRQEHVTAQLAVVTPRSVTRAYMDQIADDVPNPMYDYPVEAQDVIDRLNDLLVDYNGQNRKAIIEYMDNKSFVAESFIVGFYLGFTQSFREHMYFQWLINVAKYDAVIAAWTAKIKWSLIRPTTLIQRMDGTLITTWGGPYQPTNVQIKARDFESYVRVMPHSEYPSGSACICEALKGVGLGYLQSRYGLPELPFPFFSPIIIPGSSVVEPGVTPPGTEPFNLVFSSITEAMAVCGQSRLWGGMHFGASVPAAEDLCSDLGGFILARGAQVLNGYVFPDLIPPSP